MPGVTATWLAFSNTPPRAKQNVLSFNLARTSRPQMQAPRTPPKSPRDFPGREAASECGSNKSESNRSCPAHGNKASCVDCSRCDRATGAVLLVPIHDERNTLDTHIYTVKRHTQRHTQRHREGEGDGVQIDWSTYGNSHATFATTGRNAVEHSQNSMRRFVRPFSGASSRRTMNRTRATNPANPAAHRCRLVILTTCLHHSLAAISAT